VTARRAFLRGAGVLALGIVPVLRAQESRRVWRIAMLLPSAPPPAGDRKTASGLIPDALATLGFVEGRNLILDRRFADGRFERLPALARELAANRPDAIVTLGSTGARAVMEATATIPIVMYGNVDPVASGLVANLARPGGNLTAVLIAPEGTLAAKKIEILKEAVPAARRFAFLAPPDPGIALQIDEARMAATRLGTGIVVVTVRGGDYDSAFREMAGQRADALFVGAHTMFVRDRREVIGHANRDRLPAMYEWREQVEDGGLLSYGSSLAATTRRVAEVVVRILGGTHPGEIPIEQPTQFSLVVNAGTARAIGLKLPPSFLLRADEVIG